MGNLTAVMFTQSEVYHMSCLSTLMEKILLKILMIFSQEKNLQVKDVHQLKRKREKYVKSNWKKDMLENQMMRLLLLTNRSVISPRLESKSKLMLKKKLKACQEHSVY